MKVEALSNHKSICVMPLFEEKPQHVLRSQQLCRERWPSRSCRLHAALRSSHPFCGHGHLVFAKCRAALAAPAIGGPAVHLAKTR
eukprot:1159211-Pelagomonas_calceolata.AAC.8